MKYRRVFLKAAAVITAFSVAFVNEGAGLCTVIAAGNNPVSEQPLSKASLVSEPLFAEGTGTPSKHRGGGKTGLKYSIYNGYLSAIFNSDSAGAFSAHADFVENNFIKTVDTATGVDSSASNGTGDNGGSTAAGTESNGSGMDNNGGSGTGNDGSGTGDGTNNSGNGVSGGGNSGGTGTDGGGTDTNDSGSSDDSGSTGDGAGSDGGGSTGDGTDTNGGDNLDNPDNPDNPDDPDKPDNPDDPDNQENPDDPDNPINPDNPDDSDNPDNPDNPDDPDNPENPDNPGSVSDNSVSENSVSENSVPEKGARRAAARAAVISGDCGKSAEDSLTWVYDEETKTLTISGTGEMKDYNNYAASVKPPWAEYMPEHLVVEEGVTSIGNYAFYSECAALQGVVSLPSTLTAIGGNAFKGAAGIEEIRFADGERSLTFGDYAFKDCDHLQKIVFPTDLAGIKAASSGVYFNCTALTELDIPGSLGTLTKQMGFGYMPGVLNVRVGYGITSIERESLPSMTEIGLPVGMTEISSQLFSNATSLTKVYVITQEGPKALPDEETVMELPEGVVTIQNMAFSRCAGLQGKVSLPASLQKIEMQAFSGCTGITEIDFATDQNETERSLEFCSRAFQSCSNLKEIVFPANLTTLITDTSAYYPYEGCSGLTELTVPGTLGVTDDSGVFQHKLTPSMGFQNMRFVKNLVLGEGITDVAAGSLHTINLETVGLPDSLGKSQEGKKIPDSLLSNSGNLSLVYPLEGVMEKEALEKKREALKAAGIAVKLPKGVTAIGASAFAGYGGLNGEVILPAELVTIGDSAFANRNIRKVCFEESKTERTLAFGKLAFYGCKELEEIAFPTNLKGLTVPDASTYDRCAKLATLTIPGTLGAYEKVIEDGVEKEVFRHELTTAMGFQHMTSVEHLIVGYGIESIEKSSLPTRYNQKLLTVGLPDSLGEMPEELFRQSGLTKVYVIKKDGPEELPQGVAVKLPDSLQTVGDYVFANCGNLKGEVILPASMTTVKTYAFSGSGGITKISFLTDTNTERKLEFGGNAFWNCRGLKEIVFPANLKELTVAGATTYDSCSGLTELTIPGTLGVYEGQGENRVFVHKLTQSMGFYYMRSVERLTVGEGITEIALNSLPASPLVEAALPKSLETIPNNLFSSKNRLEAVYPTGEERQVGIAVKLPEGVKTIGNNAFYGCSNLQGKLLLPETLTSIGGDAFDRCSKLQGELCLPENLTSIGNSAFINCSELTGDLVIPDRVTSLGGQAFSGCSGLGPHLYLGDGLKQLDYGTFSDCTGITDLHTGREPLSGIYYSAFNGTPIKTVWFRGTDDTDGRVAGNEGNTGWSMVFNHFQSRVSGINKIYIDTTVDRLSPQAFWKNYADISFVGPNVVTFNGLVFPDKPVPLSTLNGTYYVTEEGALYALDPATGTAALAYCPPGVTELEMPLYLTATEEMVGTADDKYVGTYRVAGVTQHAVMAATDLTTVTAANPKQITLSVRAFADCPTLTSVNGVTTQKEANALFGLRGTPAIKKAFVNTGLREDEESPAVPGEARRELEYINPGVGRLKVKLNENNDYSVDKGAYQKLTGQAATFYIEAEAYGTSDLATRFCVYFEPSEAGFQGMAAPQEIKFNFEDSATGAPLGDQGTLLVTHDLSTGCYCIRFSQPAGTTLKLYWTTTLNQHETYYPMGTKGGSLRIWGEVEDAADTEGGDPDGEEEEIFEGFTGDEDYMMVDWNTKRVHYGMGLAARTQEAEIHSASHRPWYPKNHGIGMDNVYSNSRWTTYDPPGSENEKDIFNRDWVTAATYRYEVTLPEGMTWAGEEAFARSVYPCTDDRNRKWEVLSVSGQTLICEITETVSDPKRFYPARLDLGPSYQDSDLIVVGENWDYYHGEDKKILYRCTPTYHYKFSEPYEGAVCTAEEILKHAKAGTVELHRRYSFPDDKRGRGLPMNISFEAENKGENAATVPLKEITDEPVNFNGYLYLTAEQMAKAILSDNEYLETTKIEITGAALYQNGAPTATHTGTDGIAAVKETLLTTYTEPNPSGEATVTLTVDRSEAAAAGTGGGSADGGDASAGKNGRPTKLTLSVNGARRAEIAVDAGDSADSLGQKIDAALQAAGYLIPTGYYHITFTATEAARAHAVGSYTDTADKSYLWTIGSYEATVKTDYLQGHRDIPFDSANYMNLFPGYYDQATAKAVFTLEDGSRIEDLTKDKSYDRSLLSLSVRSMSSLTEEAINGRWICPGVVLDYTVDYRNGNSIDFGDMPFMQTFDKNQALLAPVTAQNAHLAGLYPKLSDEAYGGKTFKGRDYYLLISGEESKTLNGVWLGVEDGKDFHAETVILGSRAAIGEESKTVVRWYEKEIGPCESNSSRKQYRFYTYVLTPAEGEENPGAVSVIYANDYKYVSDSDNYSTRLYVSYNGHYQSEAIRKDIIANPEKAGTGEEKTTGDQRSSYVGRGTSVTYRLSFDEYWIGDYTLPEGALYDLLPRTYDAFNWEVGKNVKVKYALKERASESGGSGDYEPYEPEPGEDFAHIEKVMAPLQGQNEEVEQHKLSFGEFTIPYNRTLYVYVTLTFPKEQAVWDAFAEAAEVNLYNTLCKGEMRSSVSHMVARPTQAFLKTGVYGTDGDPYGYIYPNSDEEDRIVKYYVVIYNHGKSYLYLNPVQIRIPEGFTLKDPPKWYSDGKPDWNLTDVSVIDANAPANVRRAAIANAEVTYPRGEADKSEAALDISIDSGWRIYDNYDALVGKYFLQPGQYVAMEVRFETGGYAETGNEKTGGRAELPAAMPIDDSHHVGRIAQVQGVDAHRSNYVNSNEGIPEFWETNETAGDRGFTVPAYADTGKWAASQTDMIREEAKPGISKGAPTKVKLDTEIQNYDPQEGASLVYPVQWETKLVNGGTNSLTEYKVKDSVQWPYVFDGEVKLTSQISESDDRRFTIERYTSQVTPEGGGNPVEQIDRDRLKVNGKETSIAESREDALAEGSGCSAEVLNGTRVYFYKEDIFGDGHPAETFEIDFTTDRKYGVGPATYQNGRVVERERTLSYWTRFDRSKETEVSRTSYANRAVMLMQPDQPYTKADVCRGIAIDENGDPVTDTATGPLYGIMDVGSLSVVVGQSTAAWMKVKENKKPGEEDQGPQISDNVAQMLTKENKILIGDNDNTVTYTMYVRNHVAATSDPVEDADARKYSLSDMVIINTLPQEGDKMPFNSRVPRNSDYQIIPDKDKFELTVHYYDGSQAADDPDVERMSVISPDCYQILYKADENIDNADWDFYAGSAGGWNGTVPQQLKDNGWLNEADFIAAYGSLEAARSVRIEISDPNRTFSEDNKENYRSLMKAGRTIVVQYQARVETGTDENGVETPTPGECAWNSFGYRFKRFDGSKPMEASSIRTGVQIPSIPILYEKLIDYDQNPYPNPGAPQEFVFTIDKQAGYRLNDEGQEEKRTAQQLKFTVTVDTDKSENHRELRNIKDNAEIEWWTGQKAEDWDGTSFWEDGASYTVKQVTAPDTLPLFSIRVNGQSTTKFVYDGLYEPVIVVTNQSRVWSSRLYKMDTESRGWDPENKDHWSSINFLPGALFGLYTTDRMQKVDIVAIKEEAGERYTWREQYKALLDKMMEATNGEGDTAVTLYLKDFAVTDENGKISWQGLEDDSYYVRELDPPRGFMPDETFYQINRKKAVLSVYDEPGIRFPITGGVGTQPFYIAGSLLLAAGGILGERRGRRRRKKKNKPKIADRTQSLKQNKAQVRAKSRTQKCPRARGLIKIGGTTLTVALAVKILLRVIEIRRERKRGRR